jgi:hypothetical protein
MFLATHLQELNSLEDEDERATTAIATIAAIYGGRIGETILLLLLAPVNLSEQKKLAAIAYFRGSKLIDVECDCFDYPCNLEDYDYDVWFAKGQSHAEEESSAFITTKAWIDSLKVKLG